VGGDCALLKCFALNALNEQMRESLCFSHKYRQFVFFITVKELTGKALSDMRIG